MDMFFSLKTQFSVNNLGFLDMLTNVSIFPSLLFYIFLCLRSARLIVAVARVQSGSSFSSAMRSWPPSISPRSNFFSIPYWMVTEDFPLR